MRKYICLYKLPVSNETNQPYAENEEQGKNGFLPDTYALRIHVAESLVKLKKEQDSINIELHDINTIKASLNETFKDSACEELFANHGSVLMNVRRMFEYTWLANELGIMEGNEEGYFLPYVNITRAEIITTIDRVLNVE